jgi:uncharacterized lipoprotein
MRALIALFTAAFLLSGCNRNDDMQQQSTPPYDSTAPDTTLDSNPMPPAEESVPPSGDYPPPAESYPESTQESTPPSEPTPTP